jgi:hypothetical protein
MGHQGETCAGSFGKKRRSNTTAAPILLHAKAEYRMAPEGAEPSLVVLKAHE